ncbi:hypothetical protein [Hymenobacter terrenus]|uniref:hypothetical protein n=1 Tax=Hymenobacter terrenus TaxID=1629124 RepID=UPI00061909C0|nr:hypothetical protein [Hymenobacter terrenus]
MNFLASPLQPAAGAVGISSRVQLPATGRVALLFPELGGKTLPAPSAGNSPAHQPGGMTRHRSQHRAQCRAACMSKANF